MQLFYAPQAQGAEFTLPPEESAHALRVLRMGVGDRIMVADGRGRMMWCTIRNAAPKGCVVTVDNAVQGYEPLTYSLTMAVAPTKNTDRLEWFVEKAVEVGVDRIIPLECDRSERRRLNRERLVKVAVGAMKQSLKATLPQIDELTPFDAVAGMPFGGTKLIAHCPDSGEGRRWIGSCLEPAIPVLVVIGPEGDFSPREVDVAIHAGFTPVTLGDQRLRTETAALASVMALHYFSNR